MAALHPLPSPNEAGHLLAESVDRVPQHAYVSPIEEQLLSAAAVDVQVYVQERYALVAAAIVNTIEECLEHDDAKALVLSGFCDWFKTRSVAPRSFASAGPLLDVRLPEYLKAVREDLASSDPESSEYTEVALVLAGPLMDHAVPGEESERNCVKLALAIVRPTWLAHSAAAKSVLHKCGLLH